MISFSKKEGAEVGLNKKYKGKPCFQLSASFINKIFVDARLFPGACNPKAFFQKVVKRVIALGFYFEIVRADSAYLTIENLRFLRKLSLGYAIGSPATFNAVKEGIKHFKRISRKKNRLIVQLHKGVSALDLGERRTKKCRIRTFGQKDYLLSPENLKNKNWKWFCGEHM